MNKNRQYFAGAALAGLLLAGFSSCKKEYSNDEPFPDNYSQTLFVSSDNKVVYALDPSTGKRKWEYIVSSAVKSTPVKYSNALWVAAIDGTVYKLDPHKGTLISKITFPGGVYATPVGYKGTMIIPTLGNKVYAMNVGFEDINDTAWTQDMGGSVYASPTVHNIAGRGEVGLFIATVSNNKVRALDADEGTILWEFDGGVGGAFHSSPCAVNDSFLYVGNDNGNMYAIKMYDGTSKWTFTTGDQVRSSPITIGGNVLFGSSDRHFYSVDSATGLQRWKFATSERITSSPAVDNQYVYFGSYDYKMYAVDIIDGTVRWAKETSGLIQSSPVVSNGYVYYGSYDKNLYVSDTADGGVKWFFNVNGQMETSPLIDLVTETKMPSISGDYKY